jgi:hypothetical protein
VSRWTIRHGEEVRWIVGHGSRTAPRTWSEYLKGWALADLGLIWTARQPRLDAQVLEPHPAGNAQKGAV